MQPPQSPHDHVERGSCRWCGGDVPKKGGKLDLKANWHKECRNEMNLVWHPELMRKHIWDRDRGKCAECEKKFGWKGWEIHYVDHPADYPDELDLWKPDNIETLCWKCWKAENGTPPSDNS